jgi:PAS domain-containing protein
MGEHSGADCGQEMPELWGQAIRYALNRLSLDEIGQRYGDAVREYCAAYVNHEVRTVKGGDVRTVDLKGIGLNASNPAVKQGFAAEALAEAQYNADAIISGGTRRMRRTNNNDPLVDIQVFGAHGQPLKTQRIQMKFVGKDAKDCLNRLHSDEYEKYYYSNALLALPDEYCDQLLGDGPDSFKQDIQDAKSKLAAARAQGDQNACARYRKRIKTDEHLRKKIRKAGLAKDEALNAAVCPKRETLKRVAVVAHQGAMGQAVGVMAAAAPVAMMNVVLDCVQQKRTLLEALKERGLDIALAGSIQYVIGFIQIAASGVMKNAANNRLKAIAKTNALTMMASLAVENAMLVQRLVRSDMTGEEFIDAVAETNIGALASSFAGAAVGSAACVGLAPIIANMIAVQVAAGSYRNLRQAIRGYQLAKQERIAAEAECTQIVERVREWRRELNEQSERYFTEHLAVFDTAFTAMDRAILEQDGDGLIRVNAQLQQALGYEPQFRSQTEFDVFMNRDDSLQL